ncbi:fucolectin-like [Babylonia areolata]|uniref:fucolectin-like n=1 Tax=Babylonia areolata TaxID=304850 RepID=UPI003FD5B94D
MATHLSRSYFLFCWYTMSTLLILDSTCQGLQLTNVALHKPATMSSIRSELQDPQRAVDGWKNTNFPNCVHTNSSDPSSAVRWWRVDLLGLFEVHKVVITNRGDCCGSRLRDFNILVDRYLLNSSSSRQDSSILCLHHSGPVAQGATVTLNCDQPVTGRYVTLAKTPEVLHFCEMEVLAVPAEMAVRSSTFHVSRDKRATDDVIKTAWDEYVFGCTSACAAEPRCTAVNFQTNSAASGAGGTGLCQLLAYTRNSLQSENGWDFYQQSDAGFEIEFL